MPQIDKGLNETCINSSRYPLRFILRLTWHSQCPLVCHSEKKCRRSEYQKVHLSNNLPPGEIQRRGRWTRSLHIETKKHKKISWLSVSLYDRNVILYLQYGDYSVLLTSSDSLDIQSPSLHFHKGSSYGNRCRMIYELILFKTPPRALVMWNIFKNDFALSVHQSVYV